MLSHHCFLLDTKSGRIIDYNGLRVTLNTSFFSLSKKFNRVRPLKFLLGWLQYKISFMELTQFDQVPTYLLCHLNEL